MIQYVNLTAKVCNLCIFFVFLRLDYIIVKLVSDGVFIFHLTQYMSTHTPSSSWSRVGYTVPTPVSVSLPSSTLHCCWWTLIIQPPLTTPISHSQSNYSVLPTTNHASPLFALRSAKCFNTISRIAPFLPSKPNTLPTSIKRSSFCRFQATVSR
jgi:hypothetical protein